MPKRINSKVVVMLEIKSSPVIQPMTHSWRVKWVLTQINSPMKLLAVHMKVAHEDRLSVVQAVATASSFLWQPVARSDQVMAAFIITLM